MGNEQRTASQATTAILALTTVALMWAMPAHATVVDPAPKLITETVPADGVVALRFYDVPQLQRLDGEDGSLVLRDADGEAVPGEVIFPWPDYVAFVPDAPLALGTAVTLELRYGASPDLDETWEISVGPALGDIGPPEFRSEVELISNDHSDRACCGNDHCFDTFRMAHTWAQLSLSVLAEQAHRTQAIYAWTAPGVEPTGGSEAPSVSVHDDAAQGSPFVPCHTAWMLPLDGSPAVELGQGCVDRSQLVPVRHESPDIRPELAFEHCASPPVMHVDLWCAVNADRCTSDADCPRYRHHCPERAQALDGEPDAGQRPRVDSGKHCSVGGAPGSRRTGLGENLLPTLGLWLLWRRKRSTASRAL